MTELHDRLTKIRERHAAATDGTWVVQDLSDYNFNSEDEKGWWWVWRQENLPYFGGILDVRSKSDPGDPPGKPVGEAMITDNRSGAQERKDAEFISHAHQDVPALVDALEVVLKLHRPNVYDTSRCVQDGDRYPCITVNAIHAQLEK